MVNTKKKYYEANNYVSNSILKEYENNTKKAFDMFENGYGVEDISYNENFELGDAIETVIIKNKNPLYYNDNIAPQDYIAAKGFLNFLNEKNLIYHDYTTIYWIDEVFSKDEMQDLLSYYQNNLNIFNNIKKIDTFIKKIKSLDKLILLIATKKPLLSSKHKPFINSLKSIPYGDRISLKSKKKLLNLNNIFTDVMVTNSGYKILLDLVIYDDSDNTLYLFDVKSSINTPDKFKYDFIKYKYHIQSSLYKHVVETEFNESENEFINLKGFDVNLEKNSELTVPKDVKILDFRFLLISKIEGQLPVTFRVDKKLHQIGLNGGVDNYGNKIYGVLELRDKFIKAYDENNFNHHLFSKEEDRADLKLNVFNMYNPIINEKDISDINF